MRSFASFIFLSLLFSLSAHGAEWKVDQKNSSIAFSTTAKGRELLAEFSHFDADICFDMETAKGLALVTIAMRYITTSRSELTEQMGSESWFNPSKYPKARFYTRSFERKGTNEFLAHGHLTLKNITRPFTLPFNLTLSGNKVRMQSKAPLKRLYYGIGSAYPSELHAGLNVLVSIEIVAEKKESQCVVNLPK